MKPCQVYQTIFIPRLLMDDALIVIDRVKQTELRGGYIKTISFVEHLESHLGKIECGLGKIEGSWGNINIIYFPGQPFDESSTYATLGLSHHRLSLPDGRVLKQELLFTAYSTDSGKHFVSFMMDICEYILSDHNALLRGSVIELDNLIIPVSCLKSVYVTIPTIFDESLEMYQESSSELPIILIWLVPIYGVETQFVKHYGWDKFEDILERAQPDFFYLIDRLFNLRSKHSWVGRVKRILLRYNPTTGKMKCRGMLSLIRPPWLVRPLNQMTTRMHGHQSKKNVGKEFPIYLAFWFLCTCVETSFWLIQGLKRTTIPS